MRHHRLILASFTGFAFLVLAIAAAAPAAAQYGQPPPPPPPTPERGGGYAQPPPPAYYPPPPPPQPVGFVRRGFTIGGSLGGGSFATHEDGTDDSFELEGVSIEGHIGGMILPNLGILFDIWGVGGNVNDYVSVFHNIGTVSLRYFPGRIFWLQAGLGWSNFSADDSRCDPGECSSQSETGAAFVLGAGVEIAQFQHVTIDLSLRLGGGAYDGGSVTQGSAQIGINWY